MSDNESIQILIKRTRDNLGICRSGDVLRLCEEVECLGDEIARLRTVADARQKLIEGMEEEIPKLIHDINEARDAARFLNSLTSGYVYQWPWLVKK